MAATPAAASMVAVAAAAVTGPAETAAGSANAMRRATTPPAARGRCCWKANSSPSPPARSSAFAEGQRVFHIKFGNGTVTGVDGNKLTIDFDKAGRKMVLDSFVQAA